MLKNWIFGIFHPDRWVQHTKARKWISTCEFTRKSVELVSKKLIVLNWSYSYNSSVQFSSQFTWTVAKFNSSRQLEALLREEFLDFVAERTEVTKPRTTLHNNNTGSVSPFLCYCAQFCDNDALRDVCALIQTMRCTDGLNPCKQLILEYLGNLF